MKNWTALEWCMVILSLTIPVSIVGIVIMRLVSKVALSDNAASVLNNLMTLVIGGLLTKIGMATDKNKNL